MIATAERVWLAEEIAGTWIKSIQSSGYALRCDHVSLLNLKRVRGGELSS